MFLKSIHLKNIRSYTDERINFPKGSLLIGGDIGSGKSTILLAIDFALFGTRPNELPASSLLRCGSASGEVTLEFTLDGKEIEIRRVLEKKGTTIAQTAGYITINGTRKDLMSTGLKSTIIDLLGYPRADIKAGKSLIYRYTVYTPQEQMKQIMLQKPDERLNTIRSIFNIDKYRRIRENARTTARELKKTSGHLEGIAYNLNEKQQKREEIESHKKILVYEQKKIESVYAKIRENLENKKKERSKVQDTLKKLNALTRETAINKTRLENQEKTLQELREDIADMEEKLAKTENSHDIEQKIKEIEKHTGQKETLKQKERELENEIKHKEQKITETCTRKNTSEEFIKNIITLSECPTCGQAVPDAHKENIKQKEEEKIENFKKILLLHEEALGKVKQEQENLKQKIEAIHDNEKALIKLRLDLRSLKDIKESIEQKKQKQKELDISAGALKKSLEALEKDIEPIKGAEESSAKIEKELDILNAEHTITLAQVEKVRQQISGIDTEKASLDREILEKTQAKKDSESLKETTNWLKEYFILLMETMEKHIMLSIQRDFDMLFREWFNILMDDENLQARIDATFTPVIEQNTYETSYDYLSGGEKTSIALAYRLALNKIINNISEDIKTKDILILDEPTDGFSTEQLDKVRDVLAELNLKQTIIVSHEEKIESFVDKTIRVAKDSHVSHIIQ